jgi:hypothetical protein
MFEEVDDVLGGKARELTQLVTPENPQYLYNFADRSGEMDMEAPAVCGELKAGVPGGWVVKSFFAAVPLSQMTQLSIATLGQTRCQLVALCALWQHDVARHGLHQRPAAD